MADEIARLRVSITGATEAQIQRLERLDEVLAALRQKGGVKIDVSGLSQSMTSAQASAKETAKAISDQAENQKKVQVQTDSLINSQTRYNTLWSRLNGLIISNFRRSLSSALSELKAMNAEMVNIQKVTGATDADMQRLKNSAFEVAGTLGTTPSDYLSSVTKWAQAGYGALSDQLGELSAKTQVVGDVNEATANKFLLAVDAAYKYKGNIDQLTRVLDGANEISNNYATSVEKLAGGMGIVSSLAEQARMKVEETMAAIGTITAKTQESGSSAARALRALILNIQGKTEIEIDAETGERWSEEEIQRTADALKNLNIATREYKDGIVQLRNPMEVIGELAEKYQKGLVTEAQLQEVVASLGGKVRSNQLMALIQGYETYTSMIETYKDAVGSADRELDIYLAGWEAKSNKLVNQWTQFVESFKASDISMTTLDIGNFFLELVNTDLGNAIAQFGALSGAMTLVVGGFSSLKNGTKVGTEVFQLISNAAEQVSRASKDAGGGISGLTAGLKALAATPVGKITIAVGILTALSAAYDLTMRQGAKAAEKLADARTEYEQSSAKLSQLQDELKATQDRIDKLNAKDSLTILEQEELDRLKQENIELDRQITLQKMLNEAKKEERDAAAREALSKGYSGADMSFFRAATIDFWGDTKDFILRGIQGKDFDEAAKYLETSLDRLNKKKEEFLSHKPNAATWTESEQKMMEQLDSELTAYQSVAASFRAELLKNAGDLTDPELIDYWVEVGETLWESIAPAEAMTEKLNRLVAAMDEAEKTRFYEALERIQKDGKVTTDEVQNLINRFPTLKKLLDENGTTADRLAQYLTETANSSSEAADGLNGVAEGAEDAEKAMETLIADLKKYASQAQAVSDAQDELKQNGSLSLNILTALLGNYGEALDQVWLKAMAGIATQEEISDTLQKAYEADVAAYKKALLDKNMDSEDFYSAWLADNADTVKKLAAQYGVDANNYKTFADLRKAIEATEQQAETQLVKDGKVDRVTIFGQVRDAFADTQDAMLAKAKETTGLISVAYSALASMMGGIVSGMVQAGGLAGTVKGLVSNVQAERAKKEQEDAMQAIMGSLKVNLTSSSKSSGSSKGSGSTKSYYEQQIENFKKLEEAAKRTNEVLEKSDGDTSKQRIKNLQDLQAKAMAMQKDFIARGLAETSDEVNQVKLLYAGLGDDIKSIYSSLSDNLLKEHEDLIWKFELKANNSRSMEQIANDDAAMVEKYRKMQQEVHQLAEYYRSQGVRENDSLIRDLQKAWWDYEKAIRSMYQNLTEAFNDYIDESSHKIEELGRTTGNVGQIIELYAKRIQKAQETMAALEKHNIGGALNGDIQKLQEQIWGDKDAIRDIQDELWDELERAFDDIFDKAKADVDAIGDEIEAIQEQMDDINDTLSKYDKELEGILKPINATIEALEKQLTAEKKRLESLADPLNERKDALSDQIKGYYTLNPDGSIGPYIKGLDDDIDEIQGQLDDLNEELDRVNDAWNDQKNREEEALALQKKQLAVEEAQKAVEEAMLALQTARNERSVYTLKDGVWAWRADEEAVAKAEKSLAEAEKAKEEAEKDLQDYKEEQAHKIIVKRLEEQIKALEDQKKVLDKQKELINKQIDAISKQITAYEKESKARQDLIQGLIDQNKEQKEAWEEHYSALKEQYSQQLDALEAEKKAAEGRQKEAQKQYDQWMDTWKNIQKSIETPARDISEILNDIAQYGTPAMAQQVDRVTALLRQLGYTLEDINYGNGYDPDDDWGGSSSGLVSGADIIAMMKANGKAWANSTDSDERRRLHNENLMLGNIIGATYDAPSGKWDYSNVNRDAYYDIRGLQPMSLADFSNDTYAQARSRTFTSEDAYSQPSQYATYSTGGSSYVDDHSITMNGVTIGSSMLQRPLSDTLSLISLNMGT